MSTPDLLLVPVLTILIEPAYSAVVSWPAEDGRLVSALVPPYLGLGPVVLGQALAEDRSAGVEPLLQGYRTHDEVARRAARLVRGSPVDVPTQRSYLAQLKQRLEQAAAAMTPPAVLTPLFERRRRLGTRFARADYRVVWHERTDDA